jgi:hypothetical protein
LAVKFFAVVVSGVAAPMLLLFIYSGTWTLTRDTDNGNAEEHEGAEQEGAEQGEASPSCLRAEAQSLRQKLQTEWEELTWRYIARETIKLVH